MNVLNGIIWLLRWEIQIFYQNLNWCFMVWISRRYKIYLRIFFWNHEQPAGVIIFKISRSCLIGTLEHNSGSSLLRVQQQQECSLVWWYNCCNIWAVLTRIGRVIAADPEHSINRWLWNQFSSGQRALVERIGGQWER